MKKIKLTQKSLQISVRVQFSHRKINKKFDEPENLNASAQNLAMLAL